jgi:hypothetical protein
VRAALACLLLIVREELEGLDALAAGLGGTRRGGRVEHALDDFGVLGAVGALAELAGHVDGADGADGLDPVVGRGRGERVAAGGADAQRADAVGVDLVASGEERDGGLDVLDPVGRVLQAARTAAALSLVGGVEGQGDEALLGQALGVQAGGLFLHAAAGVADDDRRARPGEAVAVGVEVAGDLDAGAVEPDVRAHGGALLFLFHCRGGADGCGVRCRALRRGPGTRFARVPRRQKEQVPVREEGIRGRNLPPHIRLRILASWNARPHAGRGAETPAAEETDA